PPVLSAFHREFPDVILTVEVGNTRTIEEKILRNELDLGVVGGLPRRAELRVIPWVSDTLVLVVEAHHRWAKRKIITPKELLSEPVLGRERGSATRETYEQAFAQRELDLPRTMETGGIEAIKRAVEAGLGVAILSGYSVAREVEEGRVVTLTLKDLPLIRPLSLIYHKDKILTWAMQELLKRLDGITKSGHLGS